MIVDPNVPIQVDRSPEGAVTIHVPAGSVDWRALAKAVLPMIIQALEQVLEAKSTASPGPASLDEVAKELR